MWGGCLGNGNNFRSKFACQRQCPSIKKVIGSLRYDDVGPVEGRI